MAPSAAPRSDQSPPSSSPKTGSSGRESKPIGRSTPTVVIDSLDITFDSTEPNRKTEQKAILRVLLPSGDAFDREIERLETQMGKGPRNDIVIADPAVSTSHALIRLEGSVYSVTDVGSRNGTFVNGERINEPHILAHGDVIGMGLSKVTFRLGDHSETGAIEAADLQSVLPPPLSEDSLASALIAEGIVSDAVIERLRGESPKRRRLHQALVEDRLVDEVVLRDFMSRIFRIPTIDLKGAQIEESLAAKFPSPLASRYRLMAVAVEAGRLILAVADPTNTDAVENVKREMKLPVDVRIATSTEIAEQIARHYGPKLIGALPSGETLEYTITHSDVEIGKAPHNHIILTDPTVSNTHAVILMRDGGYSIVDLGSRNGTFVNGEQLSTHARTLRHGDAVQLGKTVLTFRNPVETTENQTAILSKEALEEVRHRAGLAGQPQLPVSGGTPPAPPASPPVDISPAPVAPPPAASPLAAIPLQADPEIVAEGDTEKKKKKKKKDDRLKAAYISGLSRIVAQVLGVVLAVLLALYVNSSMRSGQDSGKQMISTNSKGKAKIKIDQASASAAFEGGTYEPSGVVMVPGTDGVLFISDGTWDKVYWVQLNETGNQVGAIVPIPLGVEVADPEAITSTPSGTYFYIVGSQSDPQFGHKNSIVQFAFDPASQTIRGQAEVIPNLRDFLLANVPELKDIGDKPGAKDGLNIEGIAYDPTHEQLLLGLRSPLIEGDALIIPLKIKDPRAPFSAQNITVPEPHLIKLSLAGAGIRDIQYDSHLKSFLLISGGTESQTKASSGRPDFRLWEWNGSADQSNADSVPSEVATLDARMKPEGLTRVRIGSREYIFIVGDANIHTFLDYAE